MAINFRLGGNYTLNETVMDSNMEPIMHVGERVVLTSYHPINGWVVIANKIGEVVVIHQKKLSPARGRPMRVIG